MRRLFLTFTIAATLLVPAADASAAPRYVGLGDSFASGAGLGFAIGPAGCNRSTLNYAYKVYSALLATSFTDASCSSAEVAHLTNPQPLPGGGSNAAQVNSLTGAEQLVTVSIGGNDVGYGEVADTCLRTENPTTEPIPTPCTDAYVSGGENSLVALAATLGPKLDSAFAAIRAKSPNARIMLVGYMQLITPDAVGCEDKVGVSAPDAAVFEQWELAINNQSRLSALANGVEFVDMYDASAAHTACAADPEQWIEPVTGAVGAWELHPNAAGHHALAARITDLYLNPPAPPQQPSGPPATPAQSLAVKIGRSRVRPAERGAAVSLLRVGSAVVVTAALPGEAELVISRYLPGVRSGSACKLRRKSSRGKSCRYVKRVGSAGKFDLDAGKNTLYLTGRFRGRKLAAGSYRLQVAAPSAAAATHRAQADFRVIG